jgi:hypothetical protein
MNCLSSNLTSCPTPGLSDISATNISSNSATLNCSITTNVSFYGYYYTDGTNGVCHNNCTSVPSNSINISGLKPSTQYTYEVTLFCADPPGWGGWSCKGTFFTTSSNCPMTMNLIENHTSDGTYVALDTVNSIAIINSPHNITYKAEKAIHLNPNFEVKLGAIFTAIMEACQEAKLKVENFFSKSN